MMDWLSDAAETINRQAREHLGALDSAIDSAAEFGAGAASVVPGVGQAVDAARAAQDAPTGAAAAGDAVDAAGEAVGDALDRGEGFFDNIAETADSTATMFKWLVIGTIVIGVLIFLTIVGFALWFVGPRMADAMGDFLGFVEKGATAAAGAA